MPPDDGDDDGGWEPGGDGSEPSPWGLFILLAAGAWALWEYKRPGGTLNPQTKKDIAMQQYSGADNTVVLLFSFGRIKTQPALMLLQTACVDQFRIFCLYMDNPTTRS